MGRCHNFSKEQYFLTEKKLLIVLKITSKYLSPHQNNILFLSKVMPSKSSKFATPPHDYPSLLTIDMGGQNSKCILITY